MKKLLLTASVCALWTPLFAFAGQNGSQANTGPSEQQEQKQIARTTAHCKQVQQALNDATTMLQSASSSASGASQADVQNISKTVQQAKSHLDACTSELESMQSGAGGASENGGSQGQ
jgi:hypothetical protein